MADNFYPTSTFVSDETNPLLLTRSYPIFLQKNIKMENIIKKFNKSDTLVVISSYPEKNSEPAKLNAVACYARNLLLRYKLRKVVVLSEITGEGKAYRKGNILVIPCWRPADPLLFVRILQVLIKFNSVRDVLIQFEFNMLGSFVHSSLTPFFALILRLIGKKVTVMQHQVVNDLTELSGHLNVKRNTLKAVILNSGLRCFYILLGLSVNAVIVHEQLLKDRLSKWMSREKVFVISHGMEVDNSDVSKTKIRQELFLEKNDFVLLIFGYIAWYKGVDWLIRKVVEINKAHPEKNIKLIVAGGPSATLQSKAHYRKYLAKVNEMIAENGNCVVATGFIPEDKVYKYFKVADLAILPYRAMISASGPLSFALRFNKPFMVSVTLKESYRNPDFAKTIEGLGIDTKTMTFSLKGSDFEKKLFSIMENKNIFSNLKELSSNLRLLRSWENIVLEYERVIVSASHRFAFAFWKQLVAKFIYKPLSLILSFEKNY